MRITETRVKLADQHQERLLAFATITLDDAFVVRDLKIIEGLKGPFVAMPSRKVMGRCTNCSDKNHLRAQFCNQCGTELPPQPSADELSDGERPRMYVDIAHPINKRCRQQIEEAAVAAYRDELERSRQPGYGPQELDDFDERPTSQRRPARRTERAPGNVPSKKNGHDDPGAERESGAAG